MITYKTDSGILETSVNNKKSNKNALLFINVLQIMARGMAISVFHVAALGALFQLGILVNDLITIMNS